MKAETITITPGYAKELLTHNINNRPLQNERVALLTTEMNSGRWKEETGEAIKISKTNRLLDGQHRLAALIRSGKTIKFLVISGLDDDIFDVIDTGKARTAADIFSIANVKYFKILPASISLYNKIVLGYTNHRAIENKSTNAKLMQQYESNKEFWDNIMTVSSTLYNKANKLLTQSEIATHYAIYSQIDEAQAVQFMQQICTGMGITNNTLYTLRGKLIDAKGDKTHRLLSDVKNALIIKSWNAYRLGKVVTKLRYVSDIEDFPKAI